MGPEGLSSLVCAAPGLSLTSVLPVFRTEPAHVNWSLELAIILRNYYAGWHEAAG